MHIETKAAILFHLNYHFRHQTNPAPQFLKLTFLYLIKHHYIVVLVNDFITSVTTKKKSSKFVK